MKFTHEKPTVPGAYWWRFLPETKIQLVEVRLVPVEEVEKAYREAHQKGSAGMNATRDERCEAMDIDWEHSRARRVVEGKDVRVRGEREKPEDLGFCKPASEYYIAPEPRLRPFKHGEFPVEAIYWDKSWPDRDGCKTWRRVAGIEIAGIRIATNPRDLITYDDALRVGLISTDGGKTWAPCGVLEGGE